MSEILSSSENPGQRGGPAPQPGLNEISPYKQGKSQSAVHANPIKLSSNESSFGPSAEAVKAYAGESSNLFRYPDGSQSKLRQAIGAVHDLSPEQILCGNGSAELIDLFIRTYVGPGDELLLSQHHFEMCPIFGNAQAAKVVIAPEQNYRTDVGALLERVSAQTKMVVLANPNNPAGTYIPKDQLQQLHQGLPEHCVLLLDDAYAEYVTAADYDCGMDLAAENTNVVMTRTFSKIYGLAALRIGWAFCSPGMYEQVQRLRTPFNANAAAMAAATAAVADQDYVAFLRDHNARWQQLIQAKLGSLGFDVIPSVANFYLIDFTGHQTLDSARTAAFLEQEGIIPRPVSAGGGADVLRITVGTDEENEAVLAAMTKLVA